jgi:SAM-dependent methyltransferase
MAAVAPLVRFVSQNVDKRRRWHMMATTAVQPEIRQSEWFASWFDSFHYHKLYAHRDDTEAGRFLDQLIARLGPRPGARVLDLGCGAGRHSRHLASKGLRVTGMDLAAGSIREAKKSERARLRFLQHDMRVPFGRDIFDYVFNFFTSFGYFETASEHMTVVRNMAASLRPGGRLVLDYLNVRHAEARLTSDEIKKIDGVVYRLTRWTDACHFFKRIVVDDGAGALLEYVERVAKFTLQDFERMFAPYGLSLEEVHGDYGLHAYDALTSPRMILVARKKETGTEADYLRERLLRTRLSVSGETPRYDASIH